ncbi:vegetative cell wall protein gp1-like [Sparus aurata]|uniref:vegetative cell wall protein gp1-like n=1 Tax=Sparus aurata TaxID=8175 RepID=UPI0011C0F0FF|nr:vegetative cell wall protein gp1-like [Sparus aurata]
MKIDVLDFTSCQDAGDGASGRQERRAGPPSEIHLNPPTDIPLTPPHKEVPVPPKPVVPVKPRLLAPVPPPPVPPSPHLHHQPQTSTAWSRRTCSCSQQASSGSSRSTRQPSESGLVCSLTSARPGPARRLRRDLMKMMMTVIQFALSCRISLC